MHEKLKYLISAFLVALVLLIVAIDFIFWNGRFPPNCFIELLDVSGLSRYEAYVKIKSSDVDKVSLYPVNLILEGQIFSYKPSEIGVFISPHGTINNSTKVAYRSNYIIDLIKRIVGGYEKQRIPFSLAVNKDVFNAVLTGFAYNTDIASKDATFTLTEKNRYKITKEQIGKKIDYERSINALRSAFMQNERTATIEVTTLLPRVYSKSLIKYPPKYLLSEYTTYYGSHDSPNRVHNIKLASSRTNNYVMISGEVFSLLGALGAFSGDSGYKEAFVLYNGQLEPQYGGGSCQIASTLYNASLLADLEIVERHNHGIYFTIYPFGRDASIYAGSRDLKIRNNTDHPVYIKAFATDKKLIYRIYGTPNAKKVAFSRPMIFFEGEKYVPYNVMTDEAKIKINQALLSGKPYQTIVKVITNQAGYTTEKVIYSHYKMTGDRENVKIVRPEPE